MATASPAKKKLYSNLLHKLNAGKTLSGNERHQLDELSELFDDAPKAAATGDPLDVPRAHKKNSFLDFDSINI